MQEQVVSLGEELGLIKPITLDGLRRHFISSNTEWSQDIYDAMETILKESNPVIHPFLKPRDVLHYHGDLTSLKLDAIVNAGNPGGLGCFQEDHKCIDNVIHSKAGPSLRKFCRQYLEENEIDLVEKGSAFICPGGALPASYVIHTVGPIYPGDEDYKAILQKAYTSCLDLAEEHGLSSIGFPCISTGIYGMPSSVAATTAQSAVERWMSANPSSSISIVFCTFSSKDRTHYTSLNRLSKV